MGRLSLFVTLMLVSNCLLAEYGSMMPAPQATQTPTAAPAALAPATVGEPPQQPIVDKSLITSRPISAGLSETQKGQAKTLIDNLSTCTIGTYPFMTGSFDIKGTDSDFCILKISAPDATGQIVTRNCRFSKNTTTLYIASLSAVTTAGTPSQEVEAQLGPALKKECD